MQRMHMIKIWIYTEDICETVLDAVEMLFYIKVLSSQSHSCLVSPQSMISKYSYIWNLLVLYNKTNFQKESRTWQKK